MRQDLLDKHVAEDQRVEDTAQKEATEATETTEANDGPSDFKEPPGVNKDN